MNIILSFITDLDIGWLVALMATIFITFAALTFRKLNDRDSKDDEEDDEPNFDCEFL